MLGLELAYVRSSITFARSKNASPAAHIWPEPVGGIGNASVVSSVSSSELLDEEFVSTGSVLASVDLVESVAGGAGGFVTGDSDRRSFNPVAVEYRAAIENIASNNKDEIGSGPSVDLPIELAGDAWSASGAIGDDPRLAFPSPGDLARSFSSCL